MEEIEEALLLVMSSLSERFNFSLALALFILVSTLFIFMSSFFCSDCDSSTPFSSSDLETEFYPSCKSGISSSDASSLSSLLFDVCDFSFCCKFGINSFLSHEKLSMYASIRSVLIL